MRSYIVAGCAVALFVGTGVAAGSASRQADARAIFSAFTVNAQTQLRSSRCGPYVVTRGRWTGRATSPDARLAGGVVLTGKLAMNGQGTGIATGRLTIRDRRGRLRMRGDVRAVVTKRINVHGIVTGRLRRPNALLLANISLFFEPNLTFAGVRLGLASADNAAVAYSALGKCG